MVGSPFSGIYMAPLMLRITVNHPNSAFLTRFIRPIIARHAAGRHHQDTGSRVRRVQLRPHPFRPNVQPSVKWQQ